MSLQIRYFVSVTNYSPPIWLAVKTAPTFAKSAEADFVAVAADLSAVYEGWQITNDTNLFR